MCSLCITFRSAYFEIWIKKGKTKSTIDNVCFENIGVFQVPDNSKL